MVDDIHALINGFLQHQTIKSLLMQEELPPTQRFLKAGVVPFLRESPYLFYTMKPKSTISGLGEPPFQICKGTRMHNLPEHGWRDIKENKERINDQETLIMTALREGIEELGLKMDNIVQLFDMGSYGFSSATTGRNKEMWLFAAEMKTADNFLPKAEIAPSTAECRWMSEQEFNVVGRGDHRYILKNIASKLATYFNE